ncbi:Glutamate receptor ionotropic, kainate 2 [Toxocara canis]|uniref:Glutamate receptor ionotropic, kainate 2 n=1 Tax=Toxocara canis TaxID=6265 RepID=A0A0B2V0Z6_TOXCA|nr:Glutamate receptor ionotropic, kainate 2 [Toxocara canis]
MNLNSLILTFAFIECCSQAFKFGAVLDVKRDAHLAAAIDYAIQWLNAHGAYQHGEHQIELVHSNDYFDAVDTACRLLEKEKVVALFGSTNTLLNEHIERLANQVDVPFFNVVDDLRSVDSAAVSPAKIDLFPGAQLVEAISDLLAHWRWNRVIIVYSDVKRIERLEPFMERRRFASVRFSFVKINRLDYLKAAKEVEELEECGFIHRKDCSEFSRLLLDLDPESTYGFLLAALQVGLIELKHWFLITSMDMRTLDMELFRHNHARFIAVDAVDPAFAGENMTVFNYSSFVQHISDKWTEHIGTNRNLRISEAAMMFDAVMLAADAVKILKPEEKIMTRCRSPTRPHRPFKSGAKLIRALRNTSIRGLTGDLRRVSDNPLRSNFSFRILLLGYNGIIDDIGFWEPQTDVHVNMSRDSHAQLQRNVQVSDELKPHFRVTTIMERPYVMLKKNYYELDENSRLEGFCIDLLAELSRDLGFTYTIHLVKDKNYGNDVYGNGTWDGMIGEILRGEAEMAVAPLTVNFRRAEVVDFTKPFLSLGISILFKIPADNQPDVFSFLNPLPLQIWICILISIVGLTLGMYIVAHLTPYEWNLNFSCCTAHQPHPAAQFSPANSPVQLANNYSFWNTLWYVMSTMLKGGCDFGPRAVSTRLLGGTWWVFTLVIVAAYTANLAAVLTVSRTFIPIKNFDDLANQTTISYGTIQGGSTMQFFQESKISSHVKMWNYMKDRQVFVKNNAKGVEKALSENYAFLMESSSLEYEVQQNCNLTQIGGVLGSKGYGIALKKRSEWTDRISRQILLYAKRGIIEMKKTKWWRSKGASCAGPSSAVTQQRFALNMHNVAGLFIILFAGLVFAFCTVIVEFCIRSRQIANLEQRPFHEKVVEELRFALNMNKVQDHRSRKRAYAGEENQISPSTRLR